MTLPTTTKVFGETISVVHSHGTQPPDHPVPVGAVDCHHHIFDPRFPRANSRSGIWGSVDDYRALKRRLGISRSIVVSAQSYGFDNRCLVDALDALGDEARGVAAVTLDVSDADLDHLHRHGVRGARLYLIGDTPTPPDQFIDYARRVERLGWHLQVVAVDGEALVVAEKAFQALPCTLVIDHFGYVPQPEGVNHPTMAALRRLLDNGRTYVKLSAPYITSRVGPQSFADLDPVAIELINATPERVLWGTDWPHPLVTSEPKPDDAAMLDRLARWAPDAEVRRKILVDNPARLYGFQK